MLYASDWVALARQKGLPLPSHPIHSLTHQRPERLPELLVRREDVEPAVQARLLAVLPQRHLVVLREHHQSYWRHLPILRTILRWLLHQSGLPFNSSTSVPWLVFHILFTTSQDIDRLIDGQNILYKVTYQDG